MPKKNRKNAEKTRDRAKKEHLKTAKDREVAGVAIIALGVLFLACLIFSSNGESGNPVGLIGGYLGSFMKLLAGKASFGVPLLLLVAGGMVFADRYRSIAGSRFAGLLVLFFGTLGLFHMHLLPAGENYLADAAAGAGGGVLGAGLAFILYSAIGGVGGYIILIALVIIGLLLLTEISLRTLLGKIWAGIVRLFASLKTPKEGRPAQKSAERRP
ncbi:MAG: DNA translocase FtsK 4TM domain-containing protein, partial [Clostridiales bacterium]|nr:DNA translocase FtsK 4TM domain-containing protein [Clostridiales bacterium]